MATDKVSRLQEKQRRFAAEYLVDLNATQAAIRAGYSKRTAYQQGHRLLKHVEVGRLIQAAGKEREQRTGITADRVLAELHRLAFSDIRKLYKDDGTLLNPKDWPDDIALAVSGVEVIEKTSHSALDEDEDGNPTLKQEPMQVKKVKLLDKLQAINLAMQHLGMLKTRVEHTGANGGPIQTMDMSPNERARRIAFALAKGLKAAKK